MIINDKNSCINTEIKFKKHSIRKVVFSFDTTISISNELEFEQRMNTFCKHLFHRWQIQSKLRFRSFNFENRNKVFEMNEAYFKHLQTEQKIAISFRFVSEFEGKKIDRIFNFSRDIEENIDITLNRIKSNVEKEFAKKTKRKSKKNETDSAENQENQFKVRLNAIL